MEEQNNYSQTEELEREIEGDILLAAEDEKKLNPKIRFIALFTVIIGLLITFYAYNSRDKDEQPEERKLNPVIMNCLEKEGKYELVKNDDGTESEVCTLKDGATKDAVKLMNNEPALESGFKINLETARWRTLSREKENIQIDHPSTWYYTVNHEDAKALGYDKVIGFGLGEEVWDQKPHYSVEIIILGEDKDLGDDIAYSVELTRSEGLKYVLATSNKTELKDVVDIMSKTFSLLK